MNRSSKIATLMAIYGNFFLFVLKITVGILYNSIGVISDAVNSLTDIISSVIVYISVKVSGKSADKDHPYGHHRAEPIAGLIVAIFTGIVGFEVLKMAFERIIGGGGVVVKGLAPILVMTFTLVLKGGMYLYARHVGRKVKSTAIIAGSIDHRNDVLISLGVLVGVGGAYLGYDFMDSLVAMIIGVWIIYAGYKIAVDNLKFLMGEAPSEELINKIRKISLGVNSVKGINDVRAHYVGTLLHIEIHIEVDRGLTICEAHDIGKKVQNKLEKLEVVDRAFIHIDPILGSKINKR